MRKSKLSKVLKAARALVLASFFGFALLALFVQYRIRVANDWQRYAKMPKAPIPSKNDSVVVFAPHSDDETLGCGGMLALAKINGARIRVVLVTNGDGYRIGAAREYGTIRVTPEICIRYGYRRQKETLKALDKLGICSSEVTFLGYPDRGISALWNEYWGSENLYFSKATKTNHSPYINSFTRNAPYCGESVMRDIEQILRVEKPTLVYVPHPFDDHPDHYATYCFVAAAITQLRAERADFASRIRVLAYLVHRGDWPVPRGDHTNESLAPPYALSHGETKWFSLPLSPRIVRAKRDAIRCYKSQTAIEKAFLMSFARQNEIFGELKTRSVPILHSSGIIVDGQTADWKGIRPALIDPTGDHLLRELNKGGDVRAVYVCLDGKSIYIRVDCARPLSKRITYVINLRMLPRNTRVAGGCTRRHYGNAVADEGELRYSVTIKPPVLCEPSTTQWQFHNNVLELRIPRRIFDPSGTLFLQVRTRLSKLTIDKTGWVELGIPNE